MGAIKTTKATTNKSKQSTNKLSGAVLNLVNSINKKYGDNAVVIGAGKNSPIERIPTGSVELDLKLGGGIPVGRMTNISGAFSSTKTTQCLHILRQAQKLGYVCALVDVEGTTDEKYLNSLGINLDTLIYCRPEGLEEATDILVSLQKSGEVHLAVWDSIEASTPTKERESSMEDSTQMGIKQKLIAEYCRKFQAHNNRLTREGKRPFTLIATNQLREKIGQYGDPEYTPGGRAKDFTASVDIRLRRGDWIAEGKGENKCIVGQVVKFKIEKNKTYKRMQTGEFDFYFDENDAGVNKSSNDNVKSIIQEAVAYGLITRAGAWFYLNDNPKEDEKFNGLSKLVDFLRTREDLIESYKDQILELEKVNK